VTPTGGYFGFGPEIRSFFDEIRREVGSMNERNVEALAVLIQCLGLEPFDAEGKDAHSLARHLAARGVLVPSVLTDEECQEIAAYSASAVRTSQALGSHPCIASLERIAKGQA
jgi:hypothetical protein